MSSRKLVINGVTYIRSRDAAREVNLALDYISRLARHGAITGERVSGIWVVDLTSLKNFVAEQERQKEILRARFSTARQAEISDRLVSMLRKLEKQNALPVDRTFL
jgi:hypothetical protein